MGSFGEGGVPADWRGARGWQAALADELPAPFFCELPPGAIPRCGEDGLRDGPRKPQTALPDLRKLRDAPRGGAVVGGVAEATAWLGRGSRQQMARDG